MSGFQAHVARLARAAETAAPVEEHKAQPVAVPLSEAAQSLPSHVIAATDPIKLNKQAPIFRCPAWAGLPSRPYHLHCERSGTPFPALALHRFPYYLFGKNEVCDYVLEHPSVSSVHAALIFNKEHECFVLLDLGSTNGTRLQGKRVEPRRPTPIAVGSVLQFGYSTRTYELRTGVAAAVKRAREETAGEQSSSAPAGVKQEGVAVNGVSQAKHAPSATSIAPAAPTATSAPPAAPPLTTPHDMTTGDEATTSPSAGTTLQQSVAVVPNAAPVPISAPATDAKAENANVPVTSSAEVVPSTAAAAEPAAIHLYQLVIKHKDVDNPVSRGHNKGEVITRSKADALEMVRFIVKEHQREVPVDATLGFAPWTVEAFVAAVREYCEVSNKKKAGDLGMVEKGTFSDVIDEAAFKLRRGEVSAPVETQLGIHLLFRCD